jgi:predicted nucleic acid-binding protein
MHFILDCSVAITWCFIDQATPYGDNVLKALKQEQAYVPPIWDLEIANVLYQAHKKKYCTEADEAYYLELFAELNIKKLHVDFQIENLISICKEHKLTAYDACYFHLAISQNLPIATLDKELKRAILKAGGKIYLE